MIVDRAEIIKLIRNTVKIFMPINKKFLSQEEIIFWNNPIFFYLPQGWNNPIITGGTEQ